MRAKTKKFFVTPDSTSAESRREYEVRALAVFELSEVLDMIQDGRRMTALAKAAEYALGSRAALESVSPISDVYMIGQDAVVSAELSEYERGN